MLGPIGVHWYAGENKWPIIGYHPRYDKLIFTEAQCRNKEPKQWLNQAIDPDLFCEGIVQFLKNMGIESLSYISDNILENISKLRHSSVAWNVKANLDGFESIPLLETSSDNNKFRAKIPGQDEDIIVEISWSTHFEIVKVEDDPNEVS